MFEKEMSANAKTTKSLFGAALNQNPKPEAQEICTQNISNCNKTDDDKKKVDILSEYQQFYCQCQQVIYHAEMEPGEISIETPELNINEEMILKHLKH